MGDTFKMANLKKKLLDSIFSFDFEDFFEIVYVLLHYDARNYFKS